VGNQLLGSFSPFALLDEALATTKERRSLVSLAKAVRRAVVHAQAPESHASFSATTWSISAEVRSLIRRPSYGETQSPATTKHRYGSTWGSVTLSRFSTCSRELQPSPSMSSQCGKSSLEYPNRCSFCTGIVASTAKASNEEACDDAVGTTQTLIATATPATVVCHVIGES